MLKPQYSGDRLYRTACAALAASESARAYLERENDPRAQRIAIGLHQSMQDLMQEIEKADGEPSGRMDT